MQAKYLSSKPNYFKIKLSCIRFTVLIATDETNTSCKMEYVIMACGTHCS